MKKIIEVPWSGVGAAYTEDEIKVIVDMMRNTRDTYTQGKYQNEFERKFCEYNGNKHAFAVSSCTAALELAAILAKIGPGDDIIVPAHTFCATAIPFARTGAKIIWADIDPETLVVSAETLKDKITPKTRLIIVVHLYGLAADMEPIMELASETGVVVVEDCAQAFGATCNGKKVGTFGDFGCFSFHTHKNISTLGEGGMLAVKDPRLAELVPGLRHNGLRPFPEPREKYWVPAMSNVDFDLETVWPYNFCLGEFQCAIGAMSVGRNDGHIEYRRFRAERFKNGVKGYPELIFQKIPEGRRTNFHLLPAKYDSKITGKTNHNLIQLMSEKYKVKMIVQYYPLYRYPMFQKAGFGDAQCPCTDQFFDNMVSFPFHSWMPEEEFEYMINATIEALTDLRMS